MNNYARLLSDPRWKKKRKQILARDKYTCQLCGDKDSVLHVHHRAYIRGRMPWSYRNKYLVTLCYSCHDAEKGMMEEFLPLLVENMKLKLFADDFRELAYAFSAIDVCGFSNLFCRALASYLVDRNGVKEVLDMYRKGFKIKRIKRVKTRCHEAKAENAR